MVENYWPDLDEKISTKCVFDFVQTLEEQIKLKYNGVINCSLEEITYKTYGMSATQRIMSDIKKIVGPEEDGGYIEKDRDKVTSRAFKEYKFLLYSSKYFFRVFDIKVGEFFPIEIRPAEEIDNVKHEYNEYYSEEEFKNKLLSLIRTKTVKDVINFMIEL